MIINMERISPDLRLCFSDLVVSAKNSEIIHHISGVAESGKILAVMGPTGSGKTTFLNAIAGYLPLKSGDITLNGNQITNDMRRRIDLVSQQDTFLPNLTLWETLYFTAMIQIPDTVTKEQKMSRIENIVKTLNITNCLNTVMGDELHSGLSGGEKKRASIASVLLFDPDIILLDEPTTGLDSSNAHDLMQHLQNYTSECNKIIIVTIHQPSSQIFQMFSSLLLIADGQSVYFGDAQRAIDYFARFNFHCKDFYNPADFLLDLIGDGATKDTILPYANSIRNFNKPEESNIPQRPVQLDHVDGLSTSPGQQGSYKCGSSEHSRGNVHDISFSKNDSDSIQTKWPTSFWTQFVMLTWRNFKQAKGRIFEKYDMVRAIVVGVVAGIIYYQINNSLDTFRDRMGIIYFCILYWGINVTKVAVTGFSDERAVITRERRSRSYRLSAYYFSKITSEIPMILTLPVLLLSVVYWMSSLGDVSGFFIFISITVLNCLIAQSIGHTIGATVVNIDIGILTADTVMVLALLLGGFYNNHLPWWFRWAKYLSVFHYPFATLVILILGDMSPVRCSSVISDQYPQCDRNNITTLMADDVIQNAGFDQPAYCYIASMSIIIVILKLFAYFALRLKKP